MKIADERLETIAIGGKAEGLERMAMARELLALRAESTAVRELVFPNEPDDSLEELLKELKAWDAHSDANLRNLDRVTALQKENERLRMIEAAARKVTKLNRANICGMVAHKPLRHPLCGHCRLAARIEELTAALEGKYAH